MQVFWAVARFWKIVCLLSVLLAAAVVFRKPLFEAGLGFAARLALSQKGCGFACRSIEWKGNLAVFSDVELSDKENAFEARIERASFQFDWREFPKKLKGHLVVEKPRLALRQAKFWERGSDWFACTVAVRDGEVEMPGLQKAGFSYERANPHQIGRLRLAWEASSISLEGREEGEESKFGVDLAQVAAKDLQSLLLFWGVDVSGTKVQEGVLEGWIQLTREEGRWKRSSGQLAMRGISFSLPRCEGKRIDGTVDWEGTLEARRGLLGDLLPFYPEGRLRISLNHFGIETSLGGFEELSGELTYHSEAGAKWEIQGRGKTKEASFAAAWKGRGFLHSQAANWIESELRFGEGSVAAIQGKEEGERRIWSAAFRSLRAEQSALLQALAKPALPWEFSKGVLSGEGTLVLSETGIERWSLSPCKAEGIELKTEGMSFSFEKGEGRFSSEGGDAAVAGGAFQMALSRGKTLQGKEWEGQCVWEKGTLAPSHFTGWIEAEEGNRIQAGIQVCGTRDEWEIESDLAGFLIGRFLIQGGWQEDGWEIAVEKGEIEGMAFCGEGWIGPKGDFSLSFPQFEGSLEWVGKICEGSFSGSIESQSDGFQIEGDRSDWEWSLQAKIEKAGGEFPFLSPWRLANGTLELAASSNEFLCCNSEGDWVHPRGKIHFFSPLLKRTGKDWAFDLRLNGGASQIWDLTRLCGISDGRRVFFDEERSHFLGTPLQIKECVFDGEGKLETLDARCTLPWTALLSAAPFFQEWGVPSFWAAPIAGAAGMRLYYSNGGGSELSVQGSGLQWKGQPVSLDFHAAEQVGGEWKIGRCLCADFDLRGVFKKEGNLYRISNGAGQWKNGLNAEFEGKFASDFLGELSLSKARIDLGKVGSLAAELGASLQKIEGVLEGEGRLSYNGIFESDFDFIPSGLKAGSLLLENNGPLHLYFSSEKGVFFKGLDLHIFKPGLDLDCKVDLLQYDAIRSHWILNHSQIRLPAAFFAHLGKQPAFFRLFDEREDLHLMADLDFASDFSTLACSMKEGWIPFGGAVRHIQDLQLDWNEQECSASFKTAWGSHILSVGLDVDLEPKLGGSLTLQEEAVPLAEGERPLKIDWEYSDPRGLNIHAIEGSFTGLDASFHAETHLASNTLIGTARVDGRALSDFIPQKISEVLTELKMGKGYELKGRLKLENKQPFFKGLLYGKQFELFGCQFRTLLAQVDQTPDQVRIYDLKISDTAGIMKIDEILMKEEQNLWTLAIPQISILELRPSLLQKPGREMGPISPLVVRELKISDFKGILDDSRTYTAKGELHFINSFKREPSVFDLPADVLSRIVGLDLELLVPVCGTLTFELKDRFFRLLDLKEAFSQSRRSEFFLEKEEEGPFMDLDGNLKILVKMKQFVLFKFTEAFLISIEGTLGDPQYRLQKKKRFFGI